MHKFITTLSTSLELHMRTADTEYFGEKSNTGGIGRTANWRSGQPQAQLITVQAFQAISTRSRLDTQTH